MAMEVKLMKTAIVAAVLFLGVVYISGCVGRGTIAGEFAVNGTVVNGPGGEISIPTPRISVQGITTDRKIYHSAESLVLNASVHSDSDVQAVLAKAWGVNGKLAQEAFYNLSPGENTIQFSFRLPRCNVCGGISPGNYTLNFEVTAGNVTASNFTSVEIVQ
jgi:hypothetical protein